MNLSRIECKTDKLKHERSKAKTDPQVWYRIYTKGEQFATKTKGLHDILMRNRFGPPECVFDEIKKMSHSLQSDVTVTETALITDRCP